MGVRNRFNFDLPVSNPPSRVFSPSPTVIEEQSGFLFGGKVPMVVWGGSRRMRTGKGREEMEMNVAINQGCFMSVTLAD